MLPKVVAVIISNNRQADSLACLASLVRCSYPSLAIIVLDNASADGTAQAIRADFPKVTLVELKENGGYAGNNNLGFKLALAQNAQWVLVLNDDTLLAPDCLDQLIQVGLANPHIGLLGPLIYHADEPNVVQTAGGTIDHHWVTHHLGQNQVDTGQFGTPQRVAWLSGSALLVRRPVIDALAGFDERFFMYWEEVDWCLRAAGQGWLIVQVPRAKLWHKGAQKAFVPGPAVTYYMVRNQFLVMRKHGASVPARFYQWRQALRTLASWTLRPMWRGKREHRAALWQGLADYIRQRWGPRPV